MRLRFVAAVGFAAISAGVLAAQSAPQEQQDQQHPTPAATMPMGGMGGQSASRITAQTAGPLTITFGDKTAEWPAEKLAALPQTTVTVYNGHAKANQTYSGVQLIDLLKPLGVTDKPRGKDLRLYVVAEGSDGYKVVYSIGEVTPDLHEGTVIVADKLDGKTLTSSGPLQLVATGEKHPARWVRNLVAIHVRTAE